MLVKDKDLNDSFSYSDFFRFLLLLTKITKILSNREEKRNITLHNHFLFREILNERIMFYPYSK